uniref:Uncharacterized protein n=1 Tax=Anguilla anguilla TaxID=7936 RepID=A0A0E9TCM1_ANGAN
MILVHYGVHKNNNTRQLASCVVRNIFAAALLLA